MKVELSQLVFVLTAVGLGAGGPLQAQSPVAEPQLSFRSSVDLVSIQTSVRDKRGRPVEGLTTADFEVLDNGRVSPILSLRADRRSPLSLAILVDMSGSMRVGSKPTMARLAFDSLVSQLRDGEDELAVFTFDSALHERRSFTTDLSRVKGVLDDFQPFGTTSLYDATATTARQLAGRSATHKAVIIITDGIDTSSTMTAPEVSGLASSIDVPVYVVATIASVDHAAMMEDAGRSAPSDAADLRDLAEWTGGQVVLAGGYVQSVAAVSSLLDGLRQQYVLAIEAAALREWHRLEVRVKHPSAVVKARSGYFGG